MNLNTTILPIVQSQWDRFVPEPRDPLDVENDPTERAEAVSRACAIVMATTHYNDPKILAEVSEQVTGTMKLTMVDRLPPEAIKET